MASVTPAFIRTMPKVELHLHIEGTLEPELMMGLAARNRIALPWKHEAEVRQAYAFSNLQSFLDVYYQGAGVLQTAEDFRDLAVAWCERAAADHTRHAEVFFDPQTHTDRGVPIEAVMEGLLGAVSDAQQRLGLTVGLIPCFLRHLPEDAAIACFHRVLPFGDHFVAFGLDSSELGHPPEKFRRVFDRVRAAGFRTVAHAGEEGPASYIAAALEVLGVARIDHGVRCLEDRALVERLVQDRVPLTVCPLSNVKLGVFERIEQHNLRQLLEAGLCVTVNSDDPAYFGGYLNDNFIAVTNALELSAGQVLALAANAIDASFVVGARRVELKRELAAYGDGAPA